MIRFNRFTLGNGLTVIHHEDLTTQLVALNILYNVGAKDEEEDKTGFAHLFEHLMFGGSVNIPVYDEPLERVGGENNAFTNNDFTNYYLTVPKQNVETGFWLESDRMLQLAFSQKSLDIQKEVVINEFKQSYLNQPYGDVWLRLSPLAYRQHPYKWPTIGKDISHIEKAVLDDVINFFNRFYCPNNAILVVGGNISFEETQKLTRKWFDGIPSGPAYSRNLPLEPAQTDARHLTLTGDVPFDKIYKVYHMCSRHHPDFYATDLLSDVLSNGQSSRLYETLVKRKKLFSDINAYQMGYMEAGLFVISGALIKGVSFETAEQEIAQELNSVSQEVAVERELLKVKNKVESGLVFSEMNVLNKAINLAFCELFGDANLINDEIHYYRRVTGEEIRQVASQLFRTENCSTLYYKPEDNK